MTVETRKCSKCFQKLPLTVEFFHRNQTNGDGTKQYWRPECKKCANRVSKERREARKRIVAVPNPVLGTPCQICERTDQQLLFDHCHDSLKHRGWICNSCNKGIGLLGDTVSALERVILYLKQGECS